jgi:diguanylate cyclase (GGDEF)-like protein/PAS domain S-box-containing protein
MLVLGGVAAVAVWRAHGEQTWHHSLERRSSIVASLDEARVQLLLGSTWIAMAVVAEDPTLLYSLSREAAGSLDDALAQAEAQIIASGEADEVAMFGELRVQMDQLTQELDAAWEPILNSGAGRTLETAREDMLRLWPIGTTTMTTIEQLTGAQEERLATERAAADRAATVTLWLLVGLSVVAFVGGAGAATALVWSVVRPVTSLRRSVRAIASGNLDVQAAVSGPREVASLAQDFNEMASERKRAEEALRKSETRYAELFENANDIVFTLDLSGRFTSLNRVGEETTGYSREGAPAADFAEIVAPEYVAHVREMIERKLAGGGPTRYEIEIIARDGHRVPVEISTRLVYEDGKPIGIQGIARDITERKRAEDDLRQSEERYRGLFESASDLIQSVAPDGSLIYVNRAWRETLGYSEDEIPQLSLYDFIHPESREYCTETFKRVLAGETVVGVEAKFVAKDGRTIIVEGSASCSFKGGKPSATRGIFRDITARKRMEEELRELARRDRLTGALNHGAIVAELRCLLSDSDEDSLHALAMVDVDGLKSINDTYGHQIGDAVLVAVADALSREDAIVGRYGGDEFVVILPGADRDAAQRYREAVLNTLAYAGVTDAESGAHVPVVVSIGLVTYPTEASRVEELIKLADSEMYAAKRQRPVGPTGKTLPEPLGSERAARTVGELVPLLTSPGDVDEKLRLAARRLSVGADCEVVHFSMFPPEPGGATVSQSFGRLAPELIEAWDENVRSEWDSPHPLRGLVERTRRPVILEDLESDDRIPARQRQLLSAGGLRSGLVVPLLLQDRAVGLLAVGSTREKAFGPNEAQFFMAVATQVAGIARMTTLVDELRSASDRLAEARIDTVLLLAAAAEAHDETTGLHLQGVRAITEALARELGYSEERAMDLGVASVLHDIGKVRVPDLLLSNDKRLTSDEWELLKRHTVWGEELLKTRPGFELAATIARSHHERWDGSGYPEGLWGEAIPEAAAIVAVADAFDAMTSPRPYQKRTRSVAAAVREIEACAFTQFNPKVAQALIRLHRRKALPAKPTPDRDQKAAA